MSGIVFALVIIGLNRGETQTCERQVLTGKGAVWKAAEKRMPDKRWMPHICRENGLLAVDGGDFIPYLRQTAISRVSL